MSNDFFVLKRTTAHDVSVPKTFVTSDQILQDPVTEDEL